MTADYKSESCCSHTAADPATLSSQEPTKKVCSCCCTKHTDRSEAERRKLVNRLKRIEGQIRGIIGMLENDAYCNDILIQSAAVNAAVNAFNKGSSGVEKVKGLGNPFKNMTECVPACGGTNAQSSPSVSKHCIRRRNLLWNNTTSPA